MKNTEIFLTSVKTGEQTCRISANEFSQSLPPSRPEVRRDVLCPQKAPYPAGERGEGGPTSTNLKNSQFDLFLLVSAQWPISTPWMLLNDWLISNHLWDNNKVKQRHRLQGSCTCLLRDFVTRMQVKCYIAMGRVC